VFALAELLTKPRIKENKRAELRVANTGRRRDFLGKALARLPLNLEVDSNSRSNNRRSVAFVKCCCPGKKLLGLKESPGSTKP
jgi:hypothetical protein